MMKKIIKISKPDFRDRIYRQSRLSFKRNVDLRQWDTLVENQGNLSSCTGHVITTCYELQQKIKGHKNVEELSRLFVYYNARLLENLHLEDDGIISIRNLMKASAKYGLCKESLWPYSEDRVLISPDAEAYHDASTRLITNYRHINSITDMLEVLSLDKPIVLGINIFQGFMTPSEIIDLPDSGEEYIGGHAVSILGYREHDGVFLIKNSFGPDWGNGGYSWLSFDYVRQHAFEKWCFDISEQPTL
jgi:C1A family cysteine protease